MATSKPSSLMRAAPTDAAPSLAELKALRAAQRESSQRVEELKLRLFQMTERHMDQAIAIIKSWVNADKH